jgi:hypothetical protein
LELPEGSPFETYQTSSGCVNRRIKRVSRSRPPGRLTDASRGDPG